MIAVFTAYPKFLILSPIKNFKIIKCENDLRGYKFTSLILHEFSHVSKDVYDAYYILKERQPELFK